jgi:hypothetical protein
LFRYFLIILFSLGLVLSGCRAQETNKKDINTKEPQVITSGPYFWDFGKVSGGQILEHTFKLRNESKKTLNIKETNTSCGCTVSQVEKKTLLPEEETAITVKFDSRGHSGKVQQFVYVNTDNPDNPVLKFTIQADVWKQK